MHPALQMPFATVNPRSVNETKEARHRRDDLSVLERPSIIPPETQRLLMELNYIKVIIRRRRTFSFQRFPDVDGYFGRFLRLDLLRRDAAVQAGERDRNGGGGGGRNGNSPPAAATAATTTRQYGYAIGRTKALYTSLRALLSDTAADRDDASFLNGGPRDAGPQGRRFTLLELTGTHCNHHGHNESSVLPPPQPPPPAVLPLLSGMLRDYGTIRALTLDTPPQGPASASASALFQWEKYVVGEPLRAALAAAAAAVLSAPGPPADALSPHSHNHYRPHRCFSPAGDPSNPRKHWGDGDPTTTTTAATATEVVPPNNGVPRDVIPSSEALVPPGQPVVAWAAAGLSDSPLHDLAHIRSRALPSAGDRAAEWRLAQRLQTASTGASRSGGGRGGVSKWWGRGKVKMKSTSGNSSTKNAPSSAPPPPPDPRTVAQLAWAMRPLVDVQIIANFEALYTRLLNREAAEAKAAVAATTGGITANDGGGGVGVGGGESPYADTVDRFRPHLLLNGPLSGSQAEFEALVAFLLIGNAREATYIELPNLFAVGWRRGLLGNTVGNDGDDDADATVLLSKSSSPLVRNLRRWYLSPLLNGRRTAQSGADGRYNAQFIIGKGPMARAEGKNTRVASMGGLIGAILRSYGLFTQVTLIHEEAPPPTVAAVGIDTVEAVVVVPRVVYMVRADRLQLAHRRALEPLLVDVNCTLF